MGLQHRLAGEVQHAALNALKHGVQVPVEAVFQVRRLRTAGSTSGAKPSISLAHISSAWRLRLHEITKRTGLSRNTIRSWLRKAEEVAPPKYVLGKEPDKLTPFHAELEQALKADVHRLKQNRRTAKALFARIRAAGYTDGYSQITAFIRDLRERAGQTPHAFVL
ncbi:MAG: family transposase [Herminiimonas sp.]|nr:family transposase [Herminiimonas sp.]